MSFERGESTVNKAARKERHNRLQLLSPLLRNWAHVEGGLSPREKHLEKSFFWRVAALGTVFFFVLTIFPQFVITAEDFWTPPYQPELIAAEEDVGIVDDGFMIKPEFTTTTGDRTGLTDIREYTVQSGDTLSEIAALHGVNSSTILQNNNIADANSIKPGMVLKIIPVNGLIHIVVKGDTLDKIAEKYKVEKKNIIAQNNLTSDANLREGERIILPGARKADPPPAAIAQGGGQRVTGGGAAASFGGTASAGKLLRPTKGTYTQYFHYGHWAVDIASGMGTPVYSAKAGTVTKASYGWNGGYGNMILVDHGGGMVTLYGHNSELLVSAGQKVGQGQQIAKMGKSGRVYGRTGIHLHFEVRVNGEKRNPLAYF